MAPVSPSAEVVFYYAYNIIGGRWEPGERIIIKNPCYTYMYACNVIKGRWPEAESYIKKDKFWYELYVSDAVERFS